jgi:DNA-directed RNA polymerase specialized sigma24 family protein
MRPGRRQMRSCSAPVLPVEVTKVIRNLAFRGRSYFIRFGHSWQDLEQELILHYLRHHRQHDSARASAATFAARISRHRLISMLETQTAGKRGGCVANVRSLSDTTVGHGHDSQVEVGEMISSDAYDMELGRASQSTTDLLMLRIDVDRAVTRLSSELALTAELLSQGVSVTDLSRTLGISRATANRRISRLRHDFTSAGLHYYISKTKEDKWLAGRKPNPSTTGAQPKVS